MLIICLYQWFILGKYHSNITLIVQDVDHINHLMVVIVIGMVAVVAVLVILQYAMIVEDITHGVDNF